MRRRYLTVARVLVTAVCWIAGHAWLLVADPAAAAATHSAPRRLGEAESKANAYWASLISHCPGDTFYTLRSGGLEEVRKVIIHPPKAIDLSEAERLNGIEWAGKSTFDGAAWRDFKDGKWGEWHDTFLLEVDMLKQNGKWTLSGTLWFSDLRDLFKPVACDEAIATLRYSNAHLVRNCKIVSLPDLDVVCHGEINNPIRGTWSTGDIRLIVNHATRFSSALPHAASADWITWVKEGQVVNAGCHAEVGGERDVLSHCIADRIEVAAPVP
jgi:hypothetical protein